MSSDGRGRPRLEKPRRPGRTPRDEILDAAAELFTEHGYANTSTRRIADAVGMRQASLYHHFATKDDILDALLAGTVEAPLDLAAELDAEGGAPVHQLYTLMVSDVAQLCRGAWNLGALYLLPELRVDRFAQFRRRRADLRERYRLLAEAVIADCGGPADAADLPFRLVESAINRRSDDGVCPPEQPWISADGALRALGWGGDFQAVRAAAETRLALQTVAAT